MDSIPPEIVSEIVTCLASSDSSSLHAYATVSRAWQDAIERRTFHSLELKADDVDKFRQCFAAENIRRAQYLAKLEIDLKDCNPSETDICSEVATGVLKGLSDIAGQPSKLPPLTLTLSLPYSKGESEIWDLQLPEVALNIHQVDTFEFTVSGLGWYMRQAAAVKFLRHFPKVRSARISIIDVPEWGLRRRRLERQGELS